MRLSISEFSFFFFSLDIKSICRYAARLTQVVYSVDAKLPVDSYEAIIYFHCHR